MPALAVALNNAAIVTVTTDGLDILDVQVSGDCIGPELASFRVSGGSYPDGQPSTYLIWQDEHPLQAGDTVSVTFLKEGLSSRPGQTIEQLYPDDPPEPTGPFAPPEQVLRELMQQPKKHDALHFRLVGPDGAVTNGATAPEEHGFGFSVSWISQRPERARLSLHTYTLQSLIDRTNGKYHAQGWLQFGQNVVFTVAPNSALLTDASTSPLRAQRGAAKRGR
jgi:hypothetical protein